MTDPDWPDGIDYAKWPSVARPAPREAFADHLDILEETEDPMTDPQSIPVSGEQHESEMECCAGCGDANAEHWRDGGWYCYGCASCEVCQSPYCDNPEHEL